MFDKRIAAFVLLVLASWSANARAEVLNFDTYTEINQGVLGEAFGNLDFPADSMWRAIRVDFFQNSAWGNTNLTAPSGDIVLISVAHRNPDFAGEIELTSATPFDFMGAFFMSLPVNNAFDDHFSATELTIRGFLDNVLIGERTFALGVDGFDFLPVEITGINRLVFVSDKGFWLLDDFAFQASNENAEVPEPASVALWAGLGAGLFWLNRRRRRTDG